LTSTDERGGVTTNTYDAKGNLSAAKDALGNLTVYTYGAGGRPASITDPRGNVTRYEYDRFGNVSREAHPLGHVVAYLHDANGQLLSETNSRMTDGVAEMLATSYEHDKQGRLLKITHPDGSTTKTTYNDIGKPVATVDQLGRQTTNEYDFMGRLVKTTYPDASAQTIAYDAEGRRVSTTDRANRVTRFSYDSLGRLVKTTYPDGSTTGKAYDAIGRVTANTDELGNTTKYEYDPDCGCAERLLKVTNALGQVTAFAYDAGNNKVATTDAKGNTTRYEFDLLNRLTKMTYADAGVETTSYNAAGRVSARTDPAGKTTQFEYDALGRLVKVTNALGQATQYGYDEIGNRTTRFTYDKLGRRLRRVLPLGMAETYAYDAAGNLISKTDFKGMVTTHSYDPSGRLERITPDPGLGDAPVSFSYTTSGRRATMTDASGTTRYTYDERERLVSKATPQGTLAYTYDAAGNLLSTRSSNTNGVYVTYTYDALNRLSSVTDNPAATGDRPGTGTTTYSHDAAGNVTGYSYPNGVQTTHAYNNRNLLTGVSAATDVPLAGFVYTLGAAGNRLSVTESNGRTVTYSYDDLYRLTAETIDGGSTATGNGRIGYSYDAAGNRLSRTSTVAAVSSVTQTFDANDRLDGDAHDANGNITRSGDNSYAYDFAGRLTNVNDGGVRIVYDGDGHRVSKTVGGITTKYLVDENNPAGHPQVVEELTDGRTQRVYTYGRHLLSQNRLSGGTWQPAFYGYDGHGNVQFLTAAAGAVIATYTYDAFGNLLGSTGTTPNNFLYAGEQFDRDLGLYFLRARYMNTNTGRFTTMDSYEGDDGDPLSLHKYAYANSDPANKIDPTGQFSMVDMSMANSIRMELVDLNFEFGSELIYRLREDVTLNIEEYLMEKYAPPMMTFGGAAALAGGTPPIGRGGRFNWKLAKSMRNALSASVGRAMRGADKHNKLAATVARRYRRKLVKFLELAYDPATKELRTDRDVELDELMIEITLANDLSKKIKQVQTKTRRITNKEIVIFAPNVSPDSVKKAAEKGVKVLRQYHELDLEVSIAHQFSHSFYR
jgi:RHS repeat-associated protein